MAGAFLDEERIILIKELRARHRPGYVITGMTSTGAGTEIGRNSAGSRDFS